MSQKIGRRKREAAQRVNSVNPWSAMDVMRQQLAPYEESLRLDVQDILADRKGASCDSLDVAPSRIMDVLAYRASGPSAQTMPWPGERRRFDRESLPQANRMRPDILFEECYLQAINLNMAGGRVMHVGDGLVQQMAATENNAPCGDFRLPFNAFVLTTRSETLARLFLHRNDMLAHVDPKRTSISVMVSIGISIDGFRRLSLVSHAVVDETPVGMMTARIGLRTGTVRDEVEDFLSMGANEPLVLANDGSETTSPTAMNWFGKAGAGYYLTLVNILLYLTTPTASNRRVLADRTMKGESAEAQEIAVVGEDLDPIVMEPGRLVEALSSGKGRTREFHINGRIMTRGHWRALRGQASLPMPEQQWIRPYWRGLDKPERAQRPYAVQDRRTKR